MSKYFSSHWRKTDLSDSWSSRNCQYVACNFCRCRCNDSGCIKCDSGIVCKEKTTEWESEATQGSIDIEIPVTGKKLAGRTLVVFEEIYLGDAMIACHKDINDANQTIKVKGYRDCTVIKRIKADDYWKEHGDPTFIFKPNVSILLCN